MVRSMVPARSSFVPDPFSCRFSSVGSLGSGACIRTANFWPNCDTLRAHIVEHGNLICQLCDDLWSQLRHNVTNSHICVRGIVVSRNYVRNHIVDVLNDCAVRPIEHDRAARASGCSGTAECRSRMCASRACGISVHFTSGALMCPNHVRSELGQTPGQHLPAANIFLSTVCTAKPSFVWI